jgi:2-hydroxychromene-2-carboxylate isomerase
MSETFKNQGGASTSEPSRLFRWFTSKLFMTRLAHPDYLRKSRAKHEKLRSKTGARAVVEYFHQVDDGYSHLAAQLLQQFSERYNVDVICHLVSGPYGNNAPEPELLLNLAREDGCNIAPHYGLDFPLDQTMPSPELVAQASAILANQQAAGFIDCVVAVTTALWGHDQAGLTSLGKSLGSAGPTDVASRLEQGNQRRELLGHYSGAMFYYGKEWYWGVDRLYHLEARLSDLGLDTRSTEAMLAPRKEIETGALKDHGTLSLEIYPSLRSPYTAIIFDRAVELARNTGVKLVIRPVLPMVMRGVPATRKKGMYIFMDTAREARATGTAFGPIYDPIGDPVRQCYSLYPWACQQGKGSELISSFLRHAFSEGVNTNKIGGLRLVVEQAGLDWEVAQTHLGSSAWEAELEQNRLAMYDAGLWGVPSFRLLDEHGKQLLALWGQDRLWLFAKEIQRLLAEKNS